MRVRKSLFIRLLILSFLLFYVVPAGFARSAGLGRAFAASHQLMPVPAKKGQPTATATDTATSSVVESNPTTTATMEARAIASVTIDPTTFAPLDLVKVQGTQFTPGELVTISLATAAGTASVPIGTVRANTLGDFGPITVRIPFGVTAGKLQLIAFGATSKQHASAAVMVNAPAATVSIAPASAKPGDSITIKGTHFQPGETVSLDLVALATSARLGSVRVNAAGSFSFKAKVPANTPQGIVNAVASGNTSHLSSTAQISIGTVPAALILGSSSVKPGDSVSVSGKGFIPGETVSIQLTGGTLSPLTLVTVVADTRGSFSIAHLVVPTLVPSGAFTLTAYGHSSGRASTTTLTVKATSPVAPILSIIDTGHSGGTAYLLSPGSLVQLAGSGFPAGSTVKITLNGTSSVITLATLIANVHGAIGPTGVTLPANTGAGAFTLDAVRGGQSIVAIAVTVAALTPHLALSSGHLVPNDRVTVQGSGFAPGEQVVLALNGAALLTSPAAILADSNGHFSVTFLVPATVINGSNIINASGVSSRAGVSVSVSATLPVATRWYFVNGDTTGTNQTFISILNPGVAPANVKMTFLYQNGPERTYSQVVQPQSVASVNLGSVAGLGVHISTILEANRQVSAESTTTYGTGDISTALGVSGAAKTWYLAEGYTNGSFTEQVAIMNPSASFAAIDVRFLPFNNRPAREVRFVMQPLSNITIDAGQYMPGQSISVIVTADQSIVVERMMRFGLSGRGADDSIGATSASTVWLFSQGETSANQQTFFTILNPNLAAPAAVTATFFDSSGKPIGSQTVIVDALHRGNIKLNDLLPNAQVATVLTSNVPVVVERPSYNGPSNLALASSGTVIFGRNGGGLSWAFPGGNTASGNQSRLIVFNPGQVATAIHATFYSESGAMVSENLSLAANGEAVMDVNTVPGMITGHYGAVLTSTNSQVFVAEQAELNTSTRQATSTQGAGQ